MQKSDPIVAACYRDKIAANGDFLFQARLGYNWARKNIREAASKGQNFAIDWVAAQDPFAYGVLVFLDERDWPSEEEAERGHDWELALALAVFAAILLLSMFAPLIDRHLFAY